MFSLSKTNGREIAHSPTGDRIFINENSPTDNEGEIFELLDEKEVRQLIGRRVNTIEINLLKKAIQLKQRPLQEYLAIAYDKVVPMYEHKNQQEVKFEDSNMMLSAGKKRNRLFIVGASGCGKSTFLASYVKDFLKINPNFKIILFSDVDVSGDKVLSKLDIIRVNLDEKLIEKPIEPHELANSIVIFDDIDSIQNKKIRVAVESLQDSMFLQGSSKNNIEVIVTRHASSDYRATRVCLQNCTGFVLFPASKVSLPFTLKKFGLGNKEVIRIMSLPTRWAVLLTSHPMTVLYQSGAYIV